MTLKSYLYLLQLEEYDLARVRRWLSQNPQTEVKEIKKKLVYTSKIKFLKLFASILFFLPPETSVPLGLNFLTPFDFLIKTLVVFLARLKLKFFHQNLTIIAITGSYGKTTVKEALLPILSLKYPTEATTANQNTLLGVCQRILKLSSHTQYFVAEVGAYYPGDIAAVCKVLHPKIGIITAIGPMHLERFGSLENITKTKMELAQSLPQNGSLYLPFELEPNLIQFPLKVRSIEFFKSFSDVYLRLAQLLHLDTVAVKATIDSLPPPEHRRQIIKNGTMTIIDDTYNSNPSGWQLALNELKDIKSDNKILVTPGMIELGDLQESENTRLAKLSSHVCQHVVIVGYTNRQALLEGLKNSPAIVHLVTNLAETQTLLPTITVPDTAVLFENDLGDNYL